MKTNFQLKSSSRRTNARSWPFVVIGSLLAVLILFLIIAPSVLSSFFTWIISPFWHINASGITNSVESVESLQKENTDLQKRLAALSSAEIRITELTDENTELKELLGRTIISDPIFASVLRKPPYTPYDTLIIDVGSNEGVAVGDQVFALGQVIIGLVSEVHEHSSKILLFSTPGEQYNVLVGKESLPAVATAQGGGVFKIDLPRDSGVAVGDPVIIPDITSSVFGNVASVVSEPSQPFAAILVTTPVNINQLRWVQVDHGNRETDSF